ncbi:MAG: NAD(P)H-hydrate dehydratase [Thermoplasmata archaeon]|nr:NAD(P)H-hydrate dehydratase [Thermoplasmata archaeon]MCI4359998.1 NAD(P)H-hydrate dehydratase [Thermoplasmata archaeon]
MADPSDPPMTATEIAVAEANAVALGVPIDHLMENAGRAVAEEVQKRLAPPGGRIVVLAGPGNNGGDGVAAAHYLRQWGYDVEVRLLLPPSEIRSAAARQCYERIAGRLPVSVGVPRPTDLRGSALLIDALLGSGQLGPLRPPYREAVDALRESDAPVLSVDIPTGLHDPQGVRPRWTVALTALKVGMLPSNSGEVTVRDIGIPREAILGTGPGDLLYFPTATRRGRRGRSGRIVIVGGGPYSGAPALAGLAALRVGAERATIFAPAPADGRIQAFSPNLVVRSFGEERLRPRDVRPIREALYESAPKAVLIGMGAGRHPETIQALRLLIEALAGTIPLVVDADGLDAIPLILPRHGGYDIVATPNAGEFSRVFGGDPEAPAQTRLDLVRRLAEARGLTLLAKGPQDLISDGHSVAINSNHTLAMTVSGVGDVLAGAVGAFLAEGVAAMGACRLGSWLVGEAGGRASETRGFGLVATDVIEALPTALLDGFRRLHTGDPSVPPD